MTSEMKSNQKSIAQFLTKLGDSSETKVLVQTKKEGNKAKKEKKRALAKAKAL